MQWKKEQIASGIFYLAFFTELVLMLIEKSNYANPLEGRMFQLMFLLFGIKVCLTKYEKKEWITIVLLGILGSISYFASDRNDIIRFILFVIASKNISLRRVMELTFGVTLAGCLFIMALSTLGIYGTFAIEADYRGDGLELRYCLGLGHPNSLHCMVWILILLALYLYAERMKWYHFVLCMAINLGFYSITDSRTGVIVVTATILLAAIMKYWKRGREGKTIYMLGIVGIIGFYVFTVMVGIYGVEIPLFRVISDMVTGRIEFAHYLSDISTWHLFGSPLNQNSQDMGLVRWFYWYGYVPAIAYAILQVVMILYYAKKKDYLAFIVVMMFAFYHVFESHAVSPFIARNIVLLLLVGSWSEMFGLTDKRKEVAYESIS